MLLPFLPLLGGCAPDALLVDTEHAGLRVRTHGGTDVLYQGMVGDGWKEKSKCCYHHASKKPTKSLTVLEMLLVLGWEACSGWTKGAR